MRMQLLNLLIGLKISLTLFDFQFFHNWIFIFDFIFVATSQPTNFDHFLQRWITAILQKFIPQFHVIHTEYYSIANQRFLQRTEFAQFCQTTNIV